jgi:hypothetical protein
LNESNDNLYDIYNNSILESNKRINNNINNNISSSNKFKYQMNKMTNDYDINNSNEFNNNSIFNNNNPNRKLDMDNHNDQLQSTDQIKLLLHSMID